jgi:alpha-galactosidase
MQFDPERRLWLLSTPNTSYVFRLRDDDSPAHVHWGRRLTLEQALSLDLHDPPGMNFTERAGDEYAAEGGAWYGPPSLRVGYGDGGRGVEWQYLGHEVDGDRLAVRLRDRHHPLAVTLFWRVYGDSDVIERWTGLTHLAGDGDDIVVSDVDSAMWTLPPRPDYRLSHLVGDWAAETQLRRVGLPVAETVLASRRGTTGHHANPWLAVDAGDAGEEHGEVWSTALAWSGSWRIVLRRTAGGRLAWTGGAAAGGGGWRLRPGESWRSPGFAGVHTVAGGFGGVRRAWHEHAARAVLRHPDELRPVVYNSWEATGFAVHDAGQRELAGIAARAGAEVFVMDDGWFLGRRGDTAGLGDWEADPERFPDGLRPLADHVRGLGMRFGIWVEPEMVNADSRLYREHPDWVLHLPHRRRTELRHQLVLNFARADVVEWAGRWLDRLVGDNAVEFLKWDMNRPFTEAGWPSGADPDRLWFDHVRGVYAVLDRLRAAHPRLRVEGCSGGGGRADLGMLRHVDTIWASDNTDALDRIAIQRGYAEVYPARTMSAWVTDSPNELTGRRLPLAFRFHVAMAGVLGIGADLRRWGPDELREAAGLVALYKDIRPVVQLGTAHRLADGVQYTRGDRVVVIAWHRPGGFGPEPPPIRLAALEPGAVFRDDDTGRLHHGAVLLAHGLPWRPAAPAQEAAVVGYPARAVPSGAPHSQVTRLTRV